MQLVTLNAEQEPLTITEATSWIALDSTRFPSWPADLALFKRYIHSALASRAIIVCRRKHTPCTARNPFEMKMLSGITFFGCRFSGRTRQAGC